MEEYLRKREEDIVNSIRDHEAQIIACRGALQILREVREKLQSEAELGKKANEQDSGSSGHNDLQER